MSQLLSNLVQEKAVAIGGLPSSQISDATAAGRALLTSASAAAQLASLTNSFLTVSGTTISISSATSIAGAATCASTLAVTGATTLAGLSVSGNASFASPVTFNGTASFGPNSVSGSAISFTGGTLDHVTIGATTAAAGTFTTLSGSSLSISGSTTLTGAVSLGGSISGSSFTITGGSVNSTPIGATTAAAGTFTNLSASGSATLSGLAVSGAATLSGAVTFGSTAAFGSNSASGSAFTITGGSLNGTPIGASTPSTGSFTNLSATGTVTLPATTGVTASTGDNSTKLATTAFVGTAVTNARTFAYKTLSTAYTFTVSDNEVFARITGASNTVQTLPASSSIQTGWSVRLKNDGMAIVSITPQGSDTIEGSANPQLLLYKQDCNVMYDGSTFRVFWNDRRPIVYKNNLTNVASFDFVVPPGYASFEARFFRLIFATAGSLVMRLSADGGATIRSGATDYSTYYLCSYNNSSTTAGGTSYPYMYLTIESDVAGDAYPTYRTMVQAEIDTVYGQTFVRATEIQANGELGLTLLTSTQTAADSFISPNLYRIFNSSGGSLSCTAEFIGVPLT